MKCMRSESNGTVSTQLSESECSSTQLACLLLFVHLSVLMMPSSESYGAASTQRSESECSLTQLAVLESGLWPNRPAELWPRFPTQLWTTAAEVAVHANDCSPSVGRRTSSLPNLFRIIHSCISLLSPTEILTPPWLFLLLPVIVEEIADVIISRRFSPTGIGVHLSHFVLSSRLKLCFEFIISKWRWLDSRTSGSSTFFGQLELIL